MPAGAGPEGASGRNLRAGSSSTKLGVTEARLLARMRLDVCHVPLVSELRTDLHVDGRWGATPARSVHLRSCISPNAVGAVLHIGMRYLPACGTRPYVVLTVQLLNHPPQHAPATPPAYGNTRSAMCEIPPVWHQSLLHYAEVLPYFPTPSHTPRAVLTSTCTPRQRSPPLSCPSRGGR